MFVAPIPLLWLVRGSGPGRAAACGFAFGITYFGALLYWILLFGELGWAALVLMSAGFMAGFGALAPAVWRRDHPVFGTLGLAGLWTVVEWIRGMFPLGGFGGGQLGTAQVDAPALPLASVGGVWALSFAVVLVSGLLLLALERWGSGRRASALALAMRRSPWPSSRPPSRRPTQMVARSTSPRCRWTSPRCSISSAPRKTSRSPDSTSNAI